MRRLKNICVLVCLLAACDHAADQELDVERRASIGKADGSVACSCDLACVETGDCCEDFEVACAMSCASNDDCGDAEFCDRPEACGAEGTCMPMPTFCTREFAPVCGCDGETYSNDCMAATAGVSVAAAGACEGACLNDRDCGVDGYCARDFACGELVGTCERRPDFCNRAYVPVCGCDGRTYGNACMAAAAGASVVAEGACA